MIGVGVLDSDIVGKCSNALCRDADSTNENAIDQQVADLSAGRGMGLALAAELNRYPGPSHVLELADNLELTADQRANITAVRFHESESVPIGAKLIEQEADLDKQFASRTMTAESLKASTAAVAVTQGELRETHLKYHLLTAAILGAGQMQRYAELRGYGGERPMKHHHQGRGTILSVPTRDPKRVGYGCAQPTLRMRVSWHRREQSRH